MAATPALVNPAVLRWARESAGYSAADAAAHVSRRADAETLLLSWESGDARPSLTQARKLAALYKRPLAFLYLAERPDEPAPPPDYRRGPRGERKEASPAVRWRVRQMQGLREAALDLAEDDPDAFPPFPVRARRGEDPDAVAARLRDALGIGIADQLRWRSAQAAWTAWRRAIEGLSCLVFVLDRLAAEELDGFSLAFDRAPVIAVNGNKEISHGRRVFTLMHELTHVALGAPGLCSLDEHAADVETFCNRGAAALLMPAAVFRQRAAAARENGLWTNDAVRELASTFSVSAQAAFVRLLGLRLATQDQYEDWKAQFEEEVPPALAPPAEGERERGGPSFYTLYLYRMSFPYLRQVFESYHADRMSLNELSDHLGVKPKTALVLEQRFLERLRARA